MLPPVCCCCCRASRQDLRPGPEEDRGEDGVADSEKKGREREKRGEFFFPPFSPLEKKKLEKTFTHLFPRSEARASQRAPIILGTAAESVAESQARAKAGSRRVAGEAGVQRGAS